MNISEMARGFYGYGRWDAKHWFIGPVQGIGTHEKNDLEQSLEIRFRTWKKLGSHELNDCREFHRRIREVRWHFKEPRVALQQTWRPLMLLMMTFLDRLHDDDSLRHYQAQRWGASEPWTEQRGETCVIELSGLAAPNLNESVDFGQFRSERIEVICRRLNEHPPKLVVMYGRTQRDSWNAIAKCFVGREFPNEEFAEDLPRTNVIRHGSTILVCTPAPSRPVKYGKRYVVDEYWKSLGLRLRSLTES